MGRRPRNRLELRAEAEAAEALGLNTPPEKRPGAASTERRPPPRRPRACASSGRFAMSAGARSPPSTILPRATPKRLPRRSRPKEKGRISCGRLKSRCDKGLRPAQSSAGAFDLVPKPRRGPAFHEQLERPRQPVRERDGGPSGPGRHHERPTATQCPDDPSHHLRGRLALGNRTFGVAYAQRDGRELALGTTRTGRPDTHAGAAQFVAQAS